MSPKIPSNPNVHEEYFLSQKHPKAISDFSLVMQSTLQLLEYSHPLVSTRIGSRTLRIPKSSDAQVPYIKRHSI